MLLLVFFKKCGKADSLWKHTQVMVVTETLRERTG